MEPIKKITSLSNPLIKEMIKIKDHKTYRNEKKKVFIHGKKIVTELAQKKSLSILFYTKNEYEKIPAKEKFFLSDPIMKKMTGLPSNEGIAALIEMPKETDLSKKNFILVLDRIQDPGNLGTLIRTALGFSLEGIILTPSSVDYFNDKVTRSSKGCNFLLPYSILKKEEITKMKDHYFVYLADMHGKPLHQIQFQKPALLILGSESHGIGPWAKNLGTAVTVPTENIDSLNVAIAGSVILYSMRQS